MRSVLCVVLGLPLLACGGGAARAPDPAVAAVVNPASKAPVATGTPGCPELPTEPVIEQELGSGTTIKLLNDGQEPRQALRYHPVVGARTSAITSLDLDVDSPAVQMSMPTMVMSTLTDVVAVEGEEVSTLQVFEDLHAEPRADVDDYLVGAMNDSLGKLRCSSYRLRVDTRGTPLDGQAIGLTPDLVGTADQLQGYAYILPHEAVGVGASWEVHTRRVTNGIEVDQTMVVDVVSLDGDVVELRAMLSAFAAEQTVTTETTSYELTAMTILGEMASTIDLETMTNNGWFKVEVTIDALAAGTPMRMKTRLAARMASR